MTLLLNSLITCKPVSPLTCTEAKCCLCSINSFLRLGVDLGGGEVGVVGVVVMAVAEAALALACSSAASLERGLSNRWREGLYAAVSVTTAGDSGWSGGGAVR